MEERELGEEVVDAEVERVVVELEVTELLSVNDDDDDDEEEAEEAEEEEEVEEEAEAEEELLEDIVEVDDEYMVVLIVNPEVEV